MADIKKEIDSCVNDDAAFCQFVNLLPEKFDEGGEVLYNKRNVIKKFRISMAKGEAMDVVVKRYRRPNPAQRVVYGLFRKGKAERAYYNSHELLKRGISTPKGYAYMEVRECCQLQDSFFVSGVDDAPPIKDRLNVPEQFDRVMAEDLAAFASSLHQKGILHHDFNSTNVLYHEKTDGHYWFSLIDINRMDVYAEGEELPLDDCLKNMMRFTERDDVLRFVISKYAVMRGLDADELANRMVEIKDDFVRRRRRRKKILRMFK